MTNKVANIQSANIINKITISQELSTMWEFLCSAYKHELPIPHEKAHPLGNGQIKLVFEDHNGKCHTSMQLGPHQWKYKSKQ